MDKKINMGTSVLQIIALVFSVLGGVYALLGGIFIASGEPVLRTVGSIFVPVGVVFLTIALLLLLLAYRKKKRAQALLSAGRYVWAEVVDVVPNRSVRVNRRYCCNLVARYVDGSGISHIFKSPNLNRYRDPGFLGKQVKIYYEDPSFSEYYMDVDGVLGTSIEH